jgi:D-sedoheptulose 7-phosphate isomerase
MMPGNFRADAIEHLAETTRAIGALVVELDRIDCWGRRLARSLARGSRLLAAGNGGSAAHVQHLTSELVGRYRDERQPLSALALHAETSTVTAITNDYGPDEVFARQVRAHGRPGDVLLAVSTSGRSSNLLHAARTGRACGLDVWAITGPAPNPLAAMVDDALAVDAPSVPTVQEVHQLVVHLLCEAIELALPAARDVIPRRREVSRA